MLVRVLGCCLLFVASLVQAQDVPLRWLINDFPPLIEAGSSLPGEGISADMLRYLQQRMPQYHHEFETASFARIYALMELGEPVCYPHTLKLPGRERIMLFSRASLFMPSQQVLVRADGVGRLAPYLDVLGRVDVRRLLADRRLVTSISERRGYSPSISVALAEQGRGGHVLNGVNFSAPFQQLMAGWIDYLFAYPVELGWYRQQHLGERLIPMRQLEIAGDPPYTVGYVACARGEWGRQVIADIDRALLAAGPRPPWIETILKYTSSEDRERYERALAEQQPFRP